MLVMPIMRLWRQQILRSKSIPADLLIAFAANGTKLVSSLWPSHAHAVIDAGGRGLGMPELRILVPIPIAEPAIVRTQILAAAM